VKVEKFPYPVITLDFESYYSGTYGFRTHTTVEYVRDPQWQTICVGMRLETIEGAEFVAMEAWEFEAWLDEGGRELLNSSAILAHNAPFDLYVLSYHYNVHPVFILDTLSMARPIHGTEVGKSLEKLADHYEVGKKGDEAIKSIGKRREDFTQEEWTRYAAYCMQDCRLTYALLERMLADGFPTDELKLIDITVKMFTEPSVVLDEARMEQFHASEVERKRELLAELGQDKFVLMSNEKFARLLQSLGVVPPMKWSTKKKKDDFAFAKTDVEFTALGEHKNPKVRAAVAARLGVKSTINETRASRLLRMGRNGQRLPLMLLYCGAHTTRWSGGDKMNPQNWERVDEELGEGTIRLSILAPVGYQIVAGDSGQIEARVTAWVTGQDNIVEAFRDKRDVYSEFASVVYGRHVDRKKNPDDVEPGRVAKICVLGLGYGMGFAKFSATMLSGPMGGKPVHFGQDALATMRVDYRKFLSDPERVAKAQAIPCPQGLDILVHTAVCWHLVETYRANNAAITRFWYEVAPAILDTMFTLEPGEVEELGALKVTKDAIILPSGLSLKYPGLRREERGDKYGGWDYSYRAPKYAPKKPKKGADPMAPILVPHQRLYGGLLLENISQALARVIVGEQLLAVAPLYKPVTTTHDEIVLVVPEGEVKEAKATLQTIMRTSPAWCADLPLDCDVGAAKSYGDAH
jgi:DNA polymerase